MNFFLRPLTFNFGAVSDLRKYGLFYYINLCVNSCTNIVVIGVFFNADHIYMHFFRRFSLKIR